MIAPPPESAGERPAQVGILIVDATLTVRTWDAWLASATGIPSDEACGRPMASVVPNIAARGFLARFEQVLSTGEVQVLAPAFHHYLIPCAPREPSPYFDRMQQRVTLGPLTEGDRVTGVMATIEDVTARLDRERQLAAGLRDDNWKVRRESVEQLAHEAHPDLLETLLASLRVEHRDFNVLSSALRLLSTSEVDVTAPLAALLREPDADLRIQAALALGERQTQGAVDALIGALQDADVNVRYHAIEALGRMRAPDAVDALCDVAEAEDFFLVFPAIDALARIGDPRVAPRLVPMLRRADVAESAADALGELGSADVVRPLVDALNGAALVEPIARALARIHDRYERHYGGGALVAAEFQAAVAPPGAQRILDAVDGAGHDDLRALVLVLGWLRGPAVERALTRLLGQPAVRADVIEAIVRQDTGIVALLIEQLQAEDPDTRLAAIVAVGRFGDARATLPLVSLLAGDRAQVVAAASALARIGDPRAFEALLPLLSDADAAVRQGAIGALNSLGHPDMAARVVGLLASPDPLLRESAVRIAGYFGYPDTADALIARAGDADEGVRRAAIEHLPFVDDRRALAPLAEALADPAAKVRATAAQAYGHVRAADAREPLLSATRDPDAWVRYYAARSLAALRETSAVPRLAELAAGDPAMHVRLAAVESLGSIDGTGVADILLPLAGDTLTDLAAAALRALGRLDDRRAAAALAAGLRSADPARRLAAVAGLRASASADAVERLAWTAGADDEESVAVAAVEALATIGAREGPHADAAVAALVAATVEPGRRETAVTALARLPESRIARIAEGLSQPSTAVRRATIEALGRMRHPEASAAIRAALQDGDAVVREAAIRMLDQLGVRGLSATFARMARQDPARGVRRAAASSLGRDAGRDMSDDGREGAR